MYRSPAFPGFLFFGCGMTKQTELCDCSKESALLFCFAARCGNDLYFVPYLHVRYAVPFCFYPGKRAISYGKNTAINGSLFFLTKFGFSFIIIATI